MIAQETIEAIKSRVAVSDVVGETVPLKQRGSSLIGLCPFHGEKTPSFHVRDGYYHCFGCGASGNAISFLMETQGISFPDAVEILAERAGIEIKRTGRAEPAAKSRDTKRIYEVLDKALLFYHQTLKKRDPKIVEYVRKRKLGAEAIKRFGVGFAPNEWRALTEHLTAQKYDIELLIQSGLVKRGTKGEPYDTFRGRLMFPVHIGGSKIAGFGGRVVPDLYSADELQNLPKYLNSPETPVYEKKKILYGLPHALAAIRAARTVYVVEGYLDVIGFAQVGVENVVATCGTALTVEHVKRLSGLARRVVIIFDADNAGKQAAGRSFELFLNGGVDVAALFLPDGEDPDSIALREGKRTKDFIEALERRSLLSCRIENYLREYGVKSAAEIGAVAKGKIATELKTIFGRIENAIERAEFVKQAAARLGVSETDFASLTTPKEQKLPEPVVVHSALGTLELPVSSLPLIDRQLLEAVMVNRQSFPAVVIRDASLCEGLHQATLRFIFALEEIVAEDSLPEDEQKEAIGALLRAFGPSWLELWRKSYTMAQDKEVDLNLVFEQCRSAVLRNRIKQSRDLIQRQLIESQGLEEGERMKLLTDQLSLEQRSRGHNVAPERSENQVDSDS